MAGKSAEVAEQPDGGQAFPAAYMAGPNGGLYLPTTGMSLRDWFAGQALQGLLAAADEACENYAEAAHYAYTYADALIAERSK